MNNQFSTIQQISINDYKLDINHVSNISIYNNISQIGYIVDVHYKDITDIKNKMPIKGGEILKLTIISNTSKTTFNKELILTTIVSIGEQDNVHILKLSFVTKDSYLLTILRDYNYYEDTGFNIVKKYIPLLKGNNSSNSYNVIVPGFQYNKAIQYVSTFSNDFVFEKLDGFYYKSIADMMVKSDRTLTFGSNNGYNKDLIMDYREISIFSFNEGSVNIYNNVNTIYNPDTKTIDTKDIKLDDTQKNKKTFGSGANYSDFINKEINTKYVVKNQYSGAIDIDNEVSLFNKEYEIMIHGDFSIEIGDSINILFKDNFNTDPNPMLNGLWLITKFAHHLTKTEFITKIKISKNAYYKGDINSNVVS